MIRVPGRRETILTGARAMKHTPKRPRKAVVMNGTQVTLLKTFLDLECDMVTRSLEADGIGHTVETEHFPAPDGSRYALRKIVRVNEADYDQARKLLTRCFTYAGSIADPPRAPRVRSSRRVARRSRGR